MNLQAAVLLLALVTTAEGAPSLRFVSVGDWGIGSVAEEKNPGERAASEAVADAMAADVAAEGAAFVLALGDNFYQDGVANATDGLWERAWRGLWLAKRGGALSRRLNLRLSFDFRFQISRGRATPARAPRPGPGSGER